MNVHTEANATLLGRKILVTYDELSKKPHVLATRGKDRTQYMVVEGKTEPAHAIIDVKLHYVKDR